jgi:hypothetical protein
MSAARQIQTRVLDIAERGIGFRYRNKIMPEKPSSVLRSRFLTCEKGQQGGVMARIGKVRDLKPEHFALVLTAFDSDHSCGRIWLVPVLNQGVSLHFLGDHDGH